MKERWIIMSAPMVKALLDGSKTQDRRVIIPEPPKWASHWRQNEHDPLIWWMDDELKDRQGREINCRKCPYGVAGDRLWVRETHYRWGKWVKNGKTKAGRQKWRFKIVVSGAIMFAPPREAPSRTKLYWHKRPAIFLPKKLARIWLELTEVRVERLQEISAVDVLSEGLQHSVACNSGLAKYPNGVPRGINADRNCDCLEFRTLWDSINGKGAWDRNDWVWVLEFRKI